MMKIRRGAAPGVWGPGVWGPRYPRDTPSTLAQLMSLYIVVAVGRIGDLVPGLHQIPLAKFVAALAIVSWIRTRKASFPLTWMSVPPARMAIAVMGITTVSILWSVLRSASFGVITGTVLSVIVTLILVVEAASGWASVKTILRGVVYASIVLAVTAFTSKQYERAGFSSSYDPNDFAFVFVGLLPIAITFGIVSRKIKRLAYFGIACVMILATLLTESRGGFLGLIFDVVAMTFLLPFTRSGRLQFRASRSGVIARATLLVLVGIVVWYSIPQGARARLGTVTELGSDYNADISQGGRLAIWSRNLPLVFYRPWGYGAGAFDAVDGLFAGGRYRAPHNTLLQALIELGIPGCILFISTIVSSLRYLRVPRDRERDDTRIATRDEPRAFARALAIGLLGLCLCAFFLSQLFSNVIWSFVTLSCAVGMVRRLPTTTTPCLSAPEHLQSHSGDLVIVAASKSHQ
jgi:hypothetical protein